MDTTASTDTPVQESPSAEPQIAEMDAELGDSSVHLKARITPAGALAAGGLVAGILLSVTALVWVATAPKRRHPIAEALTRR